MSMKITDAPELEVGQVYVEVRDSNVDEMLCLAKRREDRRIIYTLYSVNLGFRRFEHGDEVMSKLTLKGACCGGSCAADPLEAVEKE